MAPVIWERGGGSTWRKLAAAPDRVSCCSTDEFADSFGDIKEVVVDLNAGARLKSAVDDTQVIVIKAPGAAVELTCGGHPLVALDVEPALGLSVVEGHDTGTLLGKRYVDDSGDLELLCTKGGPGALYLNRAPMRLKEAKPLPSSD